MDNFATIAVALLAAALVGFIIYKVASRSGRSDSSTGGFTRPGRPDWDRDPR